MKYLVTAAYNRSLGDDPQVYETEVEADSVEAAEYAAQVQCAEDNGFDLDIDMPLVDLFARPAPIPREDFDVEGIKAALEGDSNDAEWEALCAVADVLGIEWQNDY